MNCENCSKTSDKLYTVLNRGRYCSYCPTVHSVQLCFECRWNVLVSGTQIIDKLKIYFEPSYLRYPKLYKQRPLSKYIPPQANLSEILAKICQDYLHVETKKVGLILKSLDYYDINNIRYIKCSYSNCQYKMCGKHIVVSKVSSRNIFEKKIKGQDNTRIFCREHAPNYSKHYQDIEKSVYNFV